MAADDFEKASRVIAKVYDRRLKTTMETEDSGIERHGRSWRQLIRQTLGNTRVRKAFALGTVLFGAVEPFTNKPSAWNAVRAVLNVSKALIDDTDVYSGCYFDSDAWVAPWTKDFNQVLLDVLQKLPFERIKTTEESRFVRLIDMGNGIKAGWEYSVKDKQVESIYVDAMHVEEARAEIKRRLWAQFHDKSIIMRKNRVFSLGDNYSRVVLAVDDSFESKPSKLATTYSEYLRRPLEAGVTRSVMLYGPPGTGKSTTARTIVELMGLRSFRINIGDLGDLENATLFEALDVFQPDAVILDDFDRAERQSVLLETLEHFKQKVKLVIVTVNNRSNLDSALLRPGRIDELVLVDSMDEEIVRLMLGEYADGYELVKTWPIAFVLEYVKRRQFMSQEGAAVAVKELTNRIKQLQRYRDEDDDGLQRMLKGTKPKKHKADTDDESEDADDSARSFPS